MNPGPPEGKRKQSVAGGRASRRHEARDRAESETHGRLEDARGTAPAFHDDSSRTVTAGVPLKSEAMVEAAGMQWRPTTKKRSVILISDNPPKELAMARQSVREFANRTGANHTVSTVWVNTWPSAIEPNAQAVLKELADIGKGKYVVEGSSSSFTITVLKALVD